jgi:hypothetical protein
MPKAETKADRTTKTELILQLESRVKSAKPIVRTLFSKELRRSPKKRLIQLLKTVKVSNDGWDIIS